MAAYGAELISVPAGKMEMARDLALEMQVWFLRPVMEYELGCAFSVQQQDCLLAARHGGRASFWTNLATRIIL